MKVTITARIEQTIDIPSLDGISGDITDLTGEDVDRILEYAEGAAYEYFEEDVNSIEIWDTYIEKL